MEQSYRLIILPKAVTPPFSIAKYMVISNCRMTSTSISRVEQLPPLTVMAYIQFCAKSQLAFRPTIGALILWSTYFVIRRRKKII